MKILSGERGRRISLDVAALSLGVVVVLAFAPFNLPFVSVFGLAGLFELWARATPRRAAWRGWLFGLGLFGAGCHWLFVSVHRFGGAPAWLGVFLVCLLAAYLALYPLLVGYVSARWFRSHTPMPVSALLVLPALWTLAELLRAVLFTGFPWLSIGYAWIDTPLKAVGPVLGVFGMTWAAALSAGCLHLLWRGPRARHKATAMAGLIAIAGAASLTPHPAFWTQPAGAPLKIAMVQGNVAQDRKWMPANRWPTLEKYLRLTRDAGQAQLVIWPEAALPYLLDAVPEWYLDRLRGLLDERGQTLITGILTRDDTGHIYNSVIAFGEGANADYQKRHLVPFGEYVPVPDFIIDGLNLLNLPHSNLTPGTRKQPPFDIAGQIVDVSICYEDAFGLDIRRALPQATWLLNVSNDAWFGESIGLRQHLQIARMRAMESGRVMVRDTNTGRSAVIGADGSLLYALQPFRTVARNVTVQPRTGMTPFVYWGYLPVWLGIALSLGAAGFVSAHRRPYRIMRGGARSLRYKIGYDQQRWRD
jgi:apolipoprotein N-acyltransferase